MIFFFNYYRPKCICLSIGELVWQSKQIFLCYWLMNPKPRLLVPVDLWKATTALNAPPIQSLPPLPTGAQSWSGLNGQRLFCGAGVYWQGYNGCGTLPKTRFLYTHGAAPERGTLSRDSRGELTTVKERRETRERSRRRGRSRRSGGKRTLSNESDRHRSQKWRSTTQSATASTKRPAILGARCTGTADRAPAVEEQGAKEASLADWHSRPGGSLYSLSAFFFWPVWQVSAPDFSQWSGSRASSTSLIHGKPAEYVDLQVTAGFGATNRF